MADIHAIYLEDVTRAKADAAGDLVLANLALAVQVARDRRPYGVPLADAIQECNLALMLAAKKWDASLGVPFGAYAARGMEIAMMKAREQQWHRGIWVKAAGIKWAVAVEAFREEYGRIPTYVELRERFPNLWGSSYVAAIRSFWGSQVEELQVKYPWRKNKKANAE